MRSLPEFSRTYSNVVCIPSFNEDSRFEITLQSLNNAHQSDQALLVLVVNGAEHHSGAEHQANQKFLDWIRPLLNVNLDAITLGAYRNLSVLLIDRAGPGRRLPAREGVGLARKIATDIGLSLHAQGHVKSPWLQCTDADVSVPKDYFTALPSQPSKLSAAIYPFEHLLEGDGEQQEAMLLYESYLHYYVLGLRHAGSCYAFHTIGSLFALHAGAYAAVRGFPKRQAGEDFYVLNKLTKIAPVLPLGSLPIQVRGRRSDRVPFGTGAALEHMCGEHILTDDYRVYDPAVFDCLQQYINALTQFAQEPIPGTLHAQLSKDTSQGGVALLNALIDQGAIKAAESAAQNVRSGPPLFRRLMEWNDAFRTLKLVHALRDTTYPSMPLLDAVAKATFVPKPTSNTLKTVLQHLKQSVESTSGQSVGLIQPSM